jgi:hypothetical protein
MLTQTILITFGKFALEHKWFKMEEENNDWSGYTGYT